MTNKVIDIESYSPKSSDIFFFDNNIWMFLFCPLANFEKRKQRIYSRFLNDIKTARGTIFISSLVISEFANRYLRLDYEQWVKTEKKINASYKRDYVGKSRYKNTMAEVSAAINQIMRFCEKTPDNFNAISIHEVLRHCDHIDFNDSYYIELSKKGNYKIVSDDRDFITYKGHELTVIAIV